LRPNARFTVDRERDATALAWSPRGSVIAVGAYDGPVQLWDVSAKPRRLRILRGLHSVNHQPEAVRGVAFSPDGSLVAATDRNNTPPGPTPYFGSIAVWRAATGAPVLSPHRLPAVADSLTFDPAGKRVVVGLEDGRVQVMRAADGRVERTLHPTGAPVMALAFAPDGTLMTGTWSGIVERWDVSSGKKLSGPVLVAPAPVASISFDPSGGVFATVGGSDGTVKLWTTSTLQQFGFDFPAVAGSWGNARFTPDGRNLVVVFDDGRGVVWPAAVRAWEDHACRVAGRNLTREEWSRFVSGRSYEQVCPQFRGAPAS
jgi:WD40 repeat protein